MTDFSTEDKPSGIKFCTVVHKRPGQGISHFRELYFPRSSPRSPKSDESASRRVHQPPYNLHTRVWNLCPVRLLIHPAHWPHVGSACVHIWPSTKADVLVRIILLFFWIHNFEYQYYWTACSPLLHVVLCVCVLVTLFSCAKMAEPAMSVFVG